MLGTPATVITNSRPNTTTMALEKKINKWGIHFIWFHFTLVGCESVRRTPLDVLLLLLLLACAVCVSVCLSDCHLFLYFRLYSQIFSCLNKQTNKSEWNFAILFLSVCVSVYVLRKKYSFGLLMPKIFVNFSSFLPKFFFFFVGYVQWFQCLVSILLVFISQH